MAYGEDGADAIQLVTLQNGTRKDVSENGRFPTKFTGPTQDSKSKNNLHTSYTGLLKLQQPSKGQPSC